MSLFSNIHYDEELLDLGHQLELLRIKFQPRKELLMKKMENQEEKHVEGGLRFTVLWSIDGTMHYLSFDELGLKDCSVVISGFKRNLETIPICIGFFYVGDALYMCHHLMVCLVSLGLFGLPRYYEVKAGHPHASPWTDKVVMVYYHYWIYGEGLYQPCKPYLLSYNIVEDKWDKFEDNIYMTRERGPSFMWGEIFYSLSTMHVFGSSTICPPKRRCGKCASEKSFLCRSSTYSCGAGDDNYCNQEYAKFEVVQGKGRDYTATDIFSFDHNLC
ncbi:hypothetical protein SASPL_104456 [Salvia splendens]|uniref:Uncharacterized protein n=1 Tax=Salvia splendens TaxID=180675 RepID=A0A8X9A8F6_SALSN|nr:hypothetical protein SASPL_104456 [Salvia splendens]